MLPNAIPIIWRSLLGLLVCVLAAGFQYGPRLLNLTEVGLKWWFNTGWLVAPALGAVCCARAALNSVGRDRKAWRDLALGCGLWLGGTVAWQYYELRDITAPFPGPADAAYLGTTIFFMTGLFRYGYVSREANRVQICNFAIAVCSVALTTLILLAPQMRASTAGLAGTFVAYLYPVFWFATAAFGALCLLLYASREKRLILGLLVIGILAEALGDLFYGMSLMGADYAVGSFFDGFWFICFLLIAWAGYEQAEVVQRHSRSAPGAPCYWQSVGEAFVPAVAVSLVLLAGVGSGAFSDKIAVVFVAPAALLFSGLLGVREHWILSTERDFKAAASESRERLSAVLESTTDSVAVLDRDWRIIYMNQRAQDLLGHVPNFRVGASLWDAFPEYVGGTFDQQYRRAMETQTPVEFEEHVPTLGLWLEIHAYPSPETLSVFFRDVTARRETREQMEFLAHHDSLTGLANRVVFRRALEQALGSRTEGARVATLCLDLDDFKEVNDTLGHPAGDALLMQIAERLVGCVRDNDVVARLGGDEFAVVLHDVGDRSEVAALAERIIDAMAAPYVIDDQSVMVATSLGIALSPDHSERPDEVFKKADIALYCAKTAKTAGRGTYRFFEAAMEERVKARQALKTDLSVSLRRSELALVYQPILDLRTDEVRSFEALLRWNHPDRGAVSPLEFIPLAEETGLILPIGDWVLEQACMEARYWPASIGVAVNLSPCQIRSHRLPARIAATLVKTGLNPQRLELEITESVLLHDTDANLATLRELLDIGVRITLDDFGTGYSSLGYLQKFPFTKIKIDRSFINGLSESEESQSIVRAVIGLGHSLGVKITAEGIETRQQLDRLREQSCDEAQGYFFSRPVPGRDVAPLLRKLEADRIWWGESEVRRLG